MKNLPTQLTMKQALRNAMETTATDRIFTGDHHTGLTVREARQMQLPWSQEDRVSKKLRTMKKLGEESHIN